MTFFKPLNLFLQRNEQNKSVNKRESHWMENNHEYTIEMVYDTFNPL